MVTGIVMNFQIKKVFSMVDREVLQKKKALCAVKAGPLWQKNKAVFLSFAALFQTTASCKLCRILYQQSFLHSLSAKLSALCSLFFFLL